MENPASLLESASHGPKSAPAQMHDSMTAPQRY